MLSIEKCAVKAVIDGVNELAGESRVPSSAEEGWMRESKKKLRSHQKYAQTGWCWSNSIIFFVQMLMACGHL